MKRENWKIVKQMMKVGLFLCVVFSMVKGWDLYQYYQEFPQTEYKSNTFGISGNIVLDPQYNIYTPDFYIKIQMMNTIRSIVWFGLFFYVLFEITNYLEIREKHWVNHVINYMKKLEDKTSDFEDW